MAVAAVNFALIVSSRVNDPRVAEQLSTIIIVPLLAVLFGSRAGIIVLNVTNMLIGVLIMAVADVALVNNFFYEKLSGYEKIKSYMEGLAHA